MSGVEQDAKIIFRASWKSFNACSYNFNAACAGIYSGLDQFIELCPEFPPPFCFRRFCLQWGLIAGAKYLTGPMFQAYGRGPSPVDWIAPDKVGVGRKDLPLAMRKA